ncbi:hypothetical protein JTE90_011823 [Oedothorax gibbosus]|uniref:Uncharacterized protein n=1 Tax=Oedothorax gibbosus TaxID=931172 RepID=A0AAV6VSZ1_9ARAC|nr:hypothetical protein JTE90_011823 [Oedothorax gibbosus]
MKHLIHNLYIHQPNKKKPDLTCNQKANNTKPSSHWIPCNILNPHQTSIITAIHSALKAQMRQRKLHSYSGQVQFENEMFYYRFQLPYRCVMRSRVALTLDHKIKRRSYCVSQRDAL